MDTEVLIKDIMTSDLLTIQMEDSVAVIKKKFKTYKIHHLLVVDKDNHLVGIISKGDFYRFIYDLSFQTTGKTWSEKMIRSISSKDLMTQAPETLAPNDTIETAANMLLRNRFHAIPIVDGEALVGIVTTLDLIAFSFNRSVEHIAGEMN